MTQDSTAEPSAAPFRAAPPRVHRNPALESQSPFLPIGQGARVGMLFYLFAYRIVFPIIAALTSDGSKDLLDLRILAEFYYTALIAFPFIFYRKEYGWLHPLVLPAVFALAKAVAKNPFSLILPFDAPLVDFTVETMSNAPVLALPAIDLAWTRLQFTLIGCAALTSYLACFLFGPTFRIPRLALYRPPAIAVSSMIFIGGLVAIGAIFIIANGGVSGTILEMRFGRRALSEGSGHLVVAAKMAPIIALAWYAYEKRPFTNPLFLGSLAAALLIALLTSGSRGALILPMLTLVMLWWWRKGRALIVPTLTAAVLAMFVIGAFGAIRQDWGSRTIDLSVLNPANLRATLQTGLEDVNARDAQDAGLAVVAGANEKGLLWGKSYINASTFWVPRALWKDKPAGVDVYNMWINYVGHPIDSRPPQTGTWGIPVPAELEAYWNLGLFGVVLVFALLGMFHATLAKAAHVYAGVPIFWVFYLNSILTVSGTSKEVITLIEQTAVLIAFAIFAGIVRPNSGREAPLAIGGGARS